MFADSRWVIEQAKALGFDLCGVVRAEQFPEFQNFGEWLRRGYAGEMRYLEDPRRREPALLVENLASVIVCALNYNTAFPYSTEAAASGTAREEPRGWISRYAWGDDYHEVLAKKLQALTAILKERFAEPFAARAYVDTGPVAERVFAKYAGLGWIGKNTLLLNEALGSWLFLGVILTSLELAPTGIPSPDLCGNCRQCLDACPTEALVEPYVLDARRCLSYLTIELRGNLPEEFRAAMGRQVYGCDICQDVCPYNRGAPDSPLGEFQPRERSFEESLLQPRLEWLAGLSEQGFRQVFRRSAVQRAKWAGLVRNVCVALGNSGVRRGRPEYEKCVAVLKGLERSEISSIAESARWALSRIEYGPLGGERPLAGSNPG